MQDWLLKKESAPGCLLLKMSKYCPVAVTLRQTETSRKNCQEYKIELLKTQEPFIDIKLPAVIQAICFLMAIITYLTDQTLYCGRCGIE